MTEGALRGTARMAAMLLLAAAPDAVRAEPVTADEAMAEHRERFQPVAVLDCPKPQAPDEIIVCGRPGRPDPDRYSGPVERVPGARIPGEPIGMEAFACLRSCHQPLKIDIIKAAKIGRKIVEHILDPD